MPTCSFETCSQGLPYRTMLHSEHAEATDVLPVTRLCRGSEVILHMTCTVYMDGQLAEQSKVTLHMTCTVYMDAQMAEQSKVTLHMTCTVYMDAQLAEQSKVTLHMPCTVYVDGQLAEQCKWPPVCMRRQTAQCYGPCSSLKQQSPGGLGFLAAA